MRYGTGSSWRMLVPVVTLAAVLMSFGASQAQGLFGSAVYYTVGAQPRDVASGDLNRSGRLDLVVANAASNSVSVLLNSGNGTFGPASDYTVGHQPLAVTTARMNNDVHIDVIASNSGSGNISVLINDGMGGFGPPVHYAVGAAPWGIIAEDLNGDGSADVAVVNRDSDSFSVLFNDGYGNLSLAGTYPAGGAYISPSWLTAADFDGDEDLDIAVTKNYFNLYFRAGYVQIFRNDGSGSFSSDVVIDNGDVATTPMARDFDGDGDIDLATSGFVPSSYKLSMLLNDGSGTFADPLTYYSGGDGRARCDDFDCDGDFDVVVSRQGVGAASFAVLLNNGDATFASAFTVYVGDDPMGQTSGDFDIDGDSDVAVALMGENAVAVTMNTTNPATAAGDPGFPSRVSAYRLDQNYPNPFNPKTSIRFSLPQAADIRLAVYDVEGRQVRTLATGPRAAGTGEVSWDGRDDSGRQVPSGVYFYRLEAAEFTQQRKMVLLK